MLEGPQVFSNIAPHLMILLQLLLVCLTCWAAVQWSAHLVLDLLGSSQRSAHLVLTTFVQVYDRAARLGLGDCPSLYVMSNYDMKVRILRDLFSHDVLPTQL